MSTARDPATEARALPAWRVAAALFAIFALATWLTTRSTLWDQDEPRFSQATVEMVQSGQWLYPTFNGALRPDKPILIYWLMAIPVTLFGVSEWAVRAWAPIALALSAWLTYRVGRRFLAPRFALLAAAMLACTPMAMAMGTAATADSVLLACITAAMAAFATMLADGWRPRHFVLLALALGAAQLVKGPVGLAVPVLSVLTAMWFLRGRGELAPGFSARLALAAIVSVLVFLAWAIPANLATDGEFARIGLGRHVGGRIVKPMEGHGTLYVLGLPLYAPIVAVGFAPWIMQLPAALLALWKGHLCEPKTRALLLGWILAPFCLMSLVATKLPHYVLPIFPALSIAVAALIDSAERGVLDARELRWLRGGAWTYGAILLLELGALVYLSLQPDSGPLAAPLAALGAVALIQGAMAIALHRRGRWRDAAIASLAGSLAIWLVIGAFVLPPIEGSKLSPRLVNSIRASAPDATTLVTYGFNEPSLNFYWGPTPIRHLRDAAALEAWISEQPSCVLVIPSHKQVDLESRGVGALQELARVEGFNHAKSRKVVLLALLCPGKDR